MQSHLAAALLGQNTPTAAPEEEEKDEHDTEEADDVDEFIDEEDAESAKSTGGKSGTQNSANTSRTVTLQMLLSADILQPGNGTMSIEYLGQRFIGDLLPDGKIKSQETDIVFASPSAWAIHCKRIINPDKKSGCGWASVKYKGKKLDAYKNIWYKKKKQEEMQDKIEDPSDNEAEAELIDSKLMAAPQPPIQRVVVKHNTIANRTFTHDANTLVECVPFSNLGKIQPFLITVSTNAVLVMDFHCHLTLSEVSGYLAGQWDVNGHSKKVKIHLTVTHAFPCRCTKGDREQAPQVELEIQKQIEQQNLILVGWYHSHPTAPAAPTLRDVDSQLDYQIRMKGTSDSSYTPCIGVICSPYNAEYTSLESAIICYWIIPPPETKPNEYGRPMLMSYSVAQDNVLSHGPMEEMKKCAEFYKKEKTFVNFADKYQNNTTYLEKLKTTLNSKFPRDQNDGILWGFIKELIGYSGDEKIDTSALLQVPNLPVKPPQVSLPSLSTPSSLSTSSLTSNLMLTSNLANVLFSSGKFPSPSSLLGLPDPMAQSTLAANNMFLSPSLFKMQDTLNLLKPLSTSSPIASTSKSESKKKDLKNASALDFTTDLNLLTLKNKLDFGIPELNLPKSNFNAADLSISSVRPPKLDYSASDLSISSAKSKVTDSFGLDATIKNFMAAQGMQEPPTKIPKTDYSSMLDLSLANSKSLSINDSLSSYSGLNDLSTSQINTSKTESNNSDQPLNLAE